MRELKLRVVEEGTGEQISLPFAEACEYLRGLVLLAQVEGNREVEARTRNYLQLFQATGESIARTCLPSVIVRGPFPFGKRFAIARGGRLMYRVSPRLQYRYELRARRRGGNYGSARTFYFTFAAKGVN